MKPLTARLLSDYGMLLVLLLLVILVSLMTIKLQIPSGRGGGHSLARQIQRELGPEATVLVAAGQTAEDAAFIAALKEKLGPRVVRTVQGQPPDARQALDELNAAGTKVSAIACTQVTMVWTVFDDLPSRFPALGTPVKLAPKGYYWPDFLKADNLLNVMGQIAIIAIVAIGMTFVILTAGIDLSVGSLAALSSVITAWCIVKLGGASAGIGALILASLVAMAAGGGVGLFTGTMVTRYSMPPFIVTLSLMLLANGLAQVISNSQTISDIPSGFTWLGRDSSLLGIPNSAILMALLYGAAHFVLTRTAYGRYVYAAGGNPEAARLSGVPVQRIVASVYVISGALAGLGGVILASQMLSGSHIFAPKLELDVIAAVVVGGASLAGGRGKLSGALIGALIIAVISNWMNLMGLQERYQLIVRGSVILIAVFLDQMKSRQMAGTRSI